jgi:hypothetical protein
MYSFNRLGLLNAENSQQNFSSWVSHHIRDLFALSTMYAIVVTGKGTNFPFIHATIHISL